MAQALEELYPGIKLTIGPAIEKGFYYDVDFDATKSITDADFKKSRRPRFGNFAREKHEFKMRSVLKSRSVGTL